MPEVPQIERMTPKGHEHPLARQGTLDEVTSELGGSRKFIPLIDFLKKKAEQGIDPIEARTEIVDSKTGRKRAPHLEEFIIKEGDIKVASLKELNDKLNELGANVQILGLHSVGNPFQKVYAGLQDYNEKNSLSGFERPVLAEGPAMILAPYAFDEKGEPHIFRSVQLRQGEAVVDVARGFADAQTLETGEHLYDIEKLGERVKSNLTRVVGEEAGKQLLKMKRIVFLGAMAVNTSFTRKGAKGAYFGVEVNYDNFVQSNKVISQEEYDRRREQLDHEGLTGLVIDMTLEEYANYKRDSSLRTRDSSTDAGTDIVVIDFLAERFRELKKAEFSRKRNKVRADEVLRLKKENPGLYRSYRKVRADFKKALRWPRD